jgi:beta-glucosidase
LQGKLGFNGIINSDTGPIEMMPWGVESMSIPARYQKALQAGVDIFSGAADPTTLIDVVKKGLVSEARIDQSVSKLLKEKFDLGLFENPYVNVEEAVKTVGNKEAVAAADLALRKSIVLLRNDEKRLPLAKKTKVYFETYFQSGRNAGEAIKVSKPEYPGLEFVSTKEEADVVLLWLVPTAGGLFSSQGSKIDLNLSKNRIDVNHVNEVLNAKPTVIAINYTNPWVIEEIDKGKASSIIATFGTTQEALLDIVTGAYKPSGKMPFTTPINQAAVEANKSDVPGHMEGPGYGLFAFGHGLTY